MYDQTVLFYILGVMEACVLGSWASILYRALRHQNAAWFYSFRMAWETSTGMTHVTFL